MFLFFFGIKAIFYFGLRNYFENLLRFYIYALVFNHINFSFNTFQLFSFILNSLEFSFLSSPNFLISILSYSEAYVCISPKTFIFSSKFTHAHAFSRYLLFHRTFICTAPPHSLFIFIHYMEFSPEVTFLSLNLATILFHILQFF